MLPSGQHDIGQQCSSSEIDLGSVDEGSWMPADSPMNQLIERFTAWGQGRPDIRAIAILGSQARTDRPADEWSDLDLLIVATDPRPYLAGGEWLAELGRVR